jgi:hypothetical protein
MNFYQWLDDIFSNKEASGRVIKSWSVSGSVLTLTFADFPSGDNPVDYSVDCSSDLEKMSALFFHLPESMFTNNHIGSKHYFNAFGYIYQWFNQIKSYIFDYGFWHQINDNLQIRCVDTSATTVWRSPDAYSYYNEFRLWGKLEYQRGGQGYIQQDADIILNSVLIWSGAYDTRGFLVQDWTNKFGVIPSATKTEIKMNLEGTTYLGHNLSEILYKIAQGERFV